MELDFSEEKAYDKAIGILRDMNPYDGNSWHAAAIMIAGMNIRAGIESHAAAIESLASAVRSLNTSNRPCNTK